MVLMATTLPNDPLVQIGYIVPQFVDPDRGFGITGRAPIATRAKRAARADLRTVGKAGTFELAGFEKAIDENVQPLPDRG